VVRFIFFHQVRHPRDLGLAEVGSFLQQVARTAADPVVAIDVARAGLEFLYREVLAQPLGELPRPPRLLDQVRQVLRVGHYSFRTEEAYIHWIRRFIFYHGTRHPRELGAAEVEQFLTHLAVEGRVSASTQNQALAALLFLYGRVLEIDLGRGSFSGSSSAEVVQGALGGLTRRLALGLQLVELVVHRLEADPQLLGGERLVAAMLV